MEELARTRASWTLPGHPTLTFVSLGSRIKIIIIFLKILIVIINAHLLENIK